MNYFPRMPRTAIHQTALLVLATALVAGCGGSDPARRAQRDRAGAGAPSAAADPAYVTARVVLGTKPCGNLQAGDRVWVSNYGDGTLQWIDRTTGVAGPPIAVGSEPCGVAVGGGSVWVENYGSDDVTRVDERTGAVQATVDVGTAPYDVTFARGAAWVTDYTDGTVSRVDAVTNRRTVVRVGGLPAGIAPVAGGVWVARTDGQVIRIDARTARVTDRLTAGAGASWTAYDESTLWVSNGQAGTVTRIDARRRTVVATVPVGPNPLDGVVVDGEVYVPVKDGRIFRVDASSNAVTATFDSSVADPFVITGADGELWAADFLGTDAVRIDASAVPAD
jgi:YVTN family beta-propeller protein